MAAGKQHLQQQQGAVAAPPSSDPASVARRLWRVVRAVLYMLRRGLPSGRKLAMDLHLLLHRGKVAGKALGALFLASQSHHGHAAAFPYAAAAASCRALDPSAAAHEPAPRARREVEFSCSNTPSSAASGGGGLRLGLLGAARRRSRSRRQAQEDRVGELGYPPQCYGYGYGYGYDAAEVARVFEMLSDDDEAASASETPSPAAAQPAQVDRRADEFIRRFYEQLRAQRSAASTPDCYGASPSPYAGTTSSRAPWPVAAGIGA
ncbi:hypothetical protein BS78_04G095000 [Paspalum vaginatum]|nr:hypothetical protein BS78_04G095000 [Paspalum vaginatum]